MRNDPGCGVEVMLSFITGMWCRFSRFYFQNHRQMRMGIKSRLSKKEETTAATKMNYHPTPGSMN